jgi:hypothetical protein
MAKNLWRNRKVTHKSMKHQPLQSQELDKFKITARKETIKIK